MWAVGRRLKFGVVWEFWRMASIFRDYRYFSCTGTVVGILLAFSIISFKKRIHEYKNSYARKFMPTATQLSIMITSQRSGSSWLCSLLQSHPKIAWGQEEMSQYNRSSLVLWESYRSELEIAFHGIEMKYSEKLPEIVGFKLMYSQIPAKILTDLMEWFNQKEVLIIHLYRNASILKMVSALQAVSSGVWHVTSRKDEHTPSKSAIKFHSDISNDVKRLESSRISMQMYLDANTKEACVYNVAYEDLSGPHSSKFLRMLSSYLGISDTITTSETGLQKIFGRTCEDRIADMDAVYEIIDGTWSYSSCLSLSKKFGRARMNHVSPQVYVSDYGLSKLLNYSVVNR